MRQRACVPQIFSRRPAGSSSGRSPTPPAGVFSPMPPAFRSRSGQGAEARPLVRQLVLLDPSSAVLAEDLFREAFEAFHAGRFAEAAASWEEQASLYRDASVRRRATYWAGRALEKAGQTDSAQRLQASLVAGTSPDLYALWAATILGMPSPAGQPAGPSQRRGSWSRRFGSRLSLARAARLRPSRPRRGRRRGRGDRRPLFLAAVASERGDHRRAATLLKRRWPELGSPEEGTVPLAARRAYYPCAQGALLREIAAAASVPPALVFGLVRQESVFTVDIRSRSGAVGLMQLMPATGRQLQRRGRHGARSDLKNPVVNVRLGVTYLHQLLEAFGGDVVLALAAYNAGPARARRWKRDLESLPADEFVESIPFVESRFYIKKILYFEGAYAALYGLPASPPPTFARRDAAAPLTKPADDGPHAAPYDAARRARRLRTARSARGAEAPDLVRVRGRKEVVLLADRLLPSLDRPVDELDHLSARAADEVVVVLALPEPFVPVLLLVQPDAPHEAALEQEIEGAVDRRAADLHPRSRIRRTRSSASKCRCVEKISSKRAVRSRVVFSPLRFRNSEKIRRSSVCTLTTEA